MQRSRLFTIVVLGLVGGFSVGAARSAELPTADLREMEQLLAQLNFDPGAVDGEVDDRTRTAIRLYQEFAILPVDGEPSARLLRELRQVSQVYAEMREAAPPPEPEAATPAEPDPEPVAEAAALDPPPEAAAEILPEAAPETPEPPAEADAPADASVAVSEMAAPTAPEPGPEPATAVPAEPESDAKLVAEEAAPEAEVAEPEEPEPAVAAPAESAPDAEPTAAAPQVANAKATAPEPEQEVAKPADPLPEAAPETAPKVADSEAAAPEPKQEVAKPAAPLPEVAPEATAKAAKAVAAPEAAAEFNISGMIARLKKRDGVAAPTSGKQATSETPAATINPTDRASYERTLIWKVQRELRRIGIDPGAADGNMRTRTTSAIATYQRARGLPANGRVSEELLARLEAEAPPPVPPASAAQQPKSDTAPLDSVEPQAAGIDLMPSNGYQAFGAGYGAARTGDYGAAVKLYDQAIDGGDLALEHLAAALYNRANAYQYLGVMDKAIEDYSAAIANKPGFPAAYYNRGFAFDTTGEQVRAVEDFRKARDLGLQRLGVRSPDLPPPLR